MKQSSGITAKEISLIILGTTIFSLGLTWFIAPLGMVTGGISGLAIILRQLTQQLTGQGIPLYLTNLLLNIPLFAISIAQRGFKFARKSFYAVLWMSLSLWFCEYIPNLFQVGDDLLLGAAFGGILTGVGIGVVFKASATTGGTEMLASILKYKMPHFPIAHLILAIDGVIILSGLFIFGAPSTLYALISVVISTFVMNNILEGIHFAKAAFIMSDQNQAISQAIIAEMGRGNTGLKARGMYTKKEGEMLFVVVTPKEVATLRHLVQELDPRAFVTITDVKEVLGEGFVEACDGLTL